MTQSLLNSTSVNWDVVSPKIIEDEDKNNSNAFRFCQNYRLREGQT